MLLERSLETFSEISFLSLYLRVVLGLCSFCEKKKVRLFLSLLYKLCVAGRYTTVDASFRAESLLLVRTNLRRLVCFDKLLLIRD